MGWDNVDAFYPIIVFGLFVRFWIVSRRVWRDWERDHPSDAEG